ncbi:MAG: protein kinase [Planctomycetaceae bacterium]|nr:protein kinase [Planctomycetaceae bacterium]
MGPWDGENSNLNRLEQIVSDYQQDLDAGNAPSLDELVRQHPELAEQIRKRLSMVITPASTTNEAGDTDRTEQWVPTQEGTPASTFVYQNDPVSNSPTAGCSELLPGAQLGPYRLIRQLGQGGMGVVLDAEHQASGRRVALKLLSPDLPRTRETIDRFLNEANLAAALSHPRTTFVYEAGEVDGHFFIAMERMPGRTLRDEVQERGQLPVPQAVDYALDVLEGLEAAHKAGVIHRDVKPSNCFLDEEGRVKVGDFGLSKSLVADSDLTRTGAFLGTPQFAAPEQFRRIDVDHRTDEFAVGATLYFLLAGKPPFSGDAAAVIAQIVADDPPALSSVNAAVPKSLSRVIQGAMKKDPEQRYCHVAEFRRALLPYSSQGKSIADVGRRVAAFFVDGLLLSLVVAVISMALAAFQWLTNSSPDVGIWRGFIATLVWIPYFTASEGRFGCSFGKFWFGLRVVDADGEPPGIWRSLVRTLILPGVAWLGVDLLETRYEELMFRSDEAVFASISVWNSAVVPQLFAIAKIGACLIVCSTMRVRNGFRGIHEYLSSTRVIRLAADESSAVNLALPQMAPAVDESLPNRLGTFQVLGRLGEFVGISVLAAQDERLQRPAWICLDQSQQKVPPSRIRLARTTRQRWLIDGENDGIQWYALESVDGIALTEYTRFADLPWAVGRKVFLATCDELLSAGEDGTLPENLSTEQLWITNDGHVKLLDQPLLESRRGEGEDSQVVISQGVAGGPPAEASITRFLNDVAQLCIQDEETPGVALDLVRSQRQSPSLAIGAVASALRGMAQHSYRFRWDDRLGVLAISSGIETILYGTVAFVVAMTLGTQTNLPIAYSVATGTVIGLVLAASVAYCLRGGMAFWLTGTDVRTTSRSPASSARCAWRSVVAWTPVLSFQAVLGIWVIFLSGMVGGLGKVPLETRFTWTMLSAYLLAFGVVQIVGFVTAILQPRRGLQDILAGTYLIRH